MRIDAQLPAGNIILERIEGDDIWLRQDQRDGQEWWFYWAFRLLDAAGRRVRVHFTDRNPVGTRGSAISTDRGASWHWLDRDFTPESFEYSVPEGADEVWFSLGMVYTERDWRAFVAESGLPHQVLTQSNGGREVELLEIGAPEAARAVVVTARHHCCEMMASYALEGLVQALVEADSAELRQLKEQVKFYFIPFVDKDGVEQGDQGKLRRPHDHNRDYLAGIYAETRAIAELCRELAAEGRLAVFMDLHCPWIRGNWNEHIYQVGSPVPENWQEQQRFGAILEEVNSGELPYSVAGDLPFGEAWNKVLASEYLTSTRFAVTMPGVKLVTTFEIPYATAGEAVVNRETARAFGRGLAQALARYLG